MTLLRPLTRQAGRFLVLVAFASVAAAADDPAASESSAEGLPQQLQRLSQEQERLQARLEELEAQSAAGPPPAAERPPSPLDNLAFWGYGEAYYTHPVHDGARTEADLYRAVIGIGYQIQDRIAFNSEYEVEHAVASASDLGEMEVEQFYVDFQPVDPLTVTAGLFLMPFGLLNEHHEPTSFYGVQRNFVETLIIPSTWREGGINLHGRTGGGFGFSLGLTTGFNLAKWNFAQEFPPYVTALDLETSDVAPLQATHQELSFANASNLSEYLALDFHGVPGLVIGGAGFTGNAVKVPAPPNAPISGAERVWLGEAHARYAPGRMDLSALYAVGGITNVASANAANPGSPNPIPSAFYGFYLQAAYLAWENDLFRVSPFARWETYNMGARYEGTAGPTIPHGLVPVSAAPGDYDYWPQNHDQVWTFGANVSITSHVVVKADYQQFHLNNHFTRFDLGLGVSY